MAAVGNNVEAALPGDGSIGLPGRAAGRRRVSSRGVGAAIRSVRFVGRGAALLRFVVPRRKGEGQIHVAEFVAVQCAEAGRDLIAVLGE